MNTTVCGTKSKGRENPSPDKSEDAPERTASLSFKVFIGCPFDADQRQLIPAKEVLDKRPIPDG